MNLPIALTLFRIVLVPPIMVFLISSSRVNVLIAAVIFIAASITDWLDGRMARRWNQVTRLGTLLDPVADKLLVAAALVSLVHVDMISAWMAVVIIGRELAVTGLRAVALSMGTVVPASSFGKAKTVSPPATSGVARNAPLAKKRKGLVVVESPSEDGTCAHSLERGQNIDPIKGARRGLSVVFDQ